MRSPASRLSKAKSTSRQRILAPSIPTNKRRAARCRFFGSGVSGGEIGARFGPSLMPGGDGAAWKLLEPIWTAIAAKVDAETGKPIETATPGNPVTGGVPCSAYIGENGAGHYVKMIHNGIEYIDMQLIGEAYFLLRNLLHVSAEELSQIFARWNEGVLDSYLIEITADILKQRDPIRTIPKLFSSTMSSTVPSRKGRANGRVSMRSTWAYPPTRSQKRFLPAV